MNAMQGQAQREPEHEMPVVVVRTRTCGARRKSLVRLVCKWIPEKERHQNQCRKHSPEEPSGADNSQKYSVNESDAGVVQKQVHDVGSIDRTPLEQPEEPVVRHSDRPQRQLPVAPGFDETIGILVPKIGKAMMQAGAFCESSCRGPCWGAGQAAPTRDWPPLFGPTVRECLREPSPSRRTPGTCGKARPASRPMRHGVCREDCPASLRRPRMSRPGSADKRA